MRGVAFLAALVMLASGCDETQIKKHAPTPGAQHIAAELLHLEERVGWMHGDCLAIRNGKIQPGTAIQVVLLSKAQEIIDAKATGSVGEPNNECFALLSDRAEINRQDGRFFYKLDIDKQPPNTMAIGLVAASVQARKRDSLVEFDLNNDGVTEHAGTCLTTEGVQFYVSSNAEFDDKALWSDYYYLGYDNKPTCPP
jgi:hypothetical protein